MKKKDDIDMLKGFPLNVEQKERLLELIGNNKGGGSGSNVIHIYMDASINKIKIDGIEYDCVTVNDDSGSYKKLIDKDLYETIDSIIENSFIKYTYEDDGIKCAGMIFYIKQSVLESIVFTPTGSVNDMLLVLLKEDIPS